MTQNHIKFSVISNMTKYRRVFVLHLFRTFLLLITLQKVISTPSPRIVGGKDALEIRHQVSVRIATRDILFGGGHLCGGNVISMRSILSSAHCFFDRYVSYFLESLISIFYHQIIFQ